MKKYLIVFAGMIFFSSCVAKRYLTQSQSQTSLAKVGRNV